MDNQVNNFCCEKLREVVNEQETPLQDAHNNAKDIGFAARRISFCPFCGILFYGERLKKEPYDDFCCRTMNHNLNFCDQSDEFDLYYQSFARKYFFSKCKHWKKFDDILFGPTHYKEWDIQYCIFCGKKLPESLYKEWKSLIQEKFGFTPDLSTCAKEEETLSKLPEEYKTDLWWKKLGL